MKILVDEKKCQGSGECAKACPHGAMQVVNGLAVVDHEKCDLDGLCIPACPHDAVCFSEEA
ncbi:MAG: 4Fe-4S binding protein [Desulfuromonadales bacterium]|nr:4Fe-4S binding protein [Desulfuromonadales bacterium]